MAALLAERVDNRHDAAFVLAKGVCSTEASVAASLFATKTLGTLISRDRGSRHGFVSHEHHCRSRSVHEEVHVEGGQESSLLRTIEVGFAIETEDGFAGEFQGPGAALGLGEDVATKPRRSDHVVARSGEYGWSKHPS